MAERASLEVRPASLVKSGTRPTNSGCRYLAAAAAASTRTSRKTTPVGHVRRWSRCSASRLRGPRQEHRGAETGDCRQHGRDMAVCWVVICVATNCYGD